MPDAGFVRTEIGKHAGGISRAAVSAAVRNFEKMPMTDTEAKRIYERLLKKL